MTARTKTEIPVIPLAELVGSWETALEAKGRSEATIKAYTVSVTGFLAWHAETGPADPVLDQASVAAYLADLRRAGQSPGTCRLRYSALRLFSKWLAAMALRAGDGLDGMEPPQNRQRRVPKLRDDEVEALRKACKGSRFQDFRDRAILALMIDTGLRAGELCGLNEDDVDTKRKLARVRHGKGDKERVVPYSAKTAEAIDQYKLRARRRHRLAGTPPLWLGIPASSGRFGYQGLAQAMGKRAKAAGVPNFHVHRLRHTFASQWLRDQGSEDGLMAMTGWSSRDMINVYTADTQAERAILEFRRLEATRARR